MWQFTAESDSSIDLLGAAWVQSWQLPLHYSWWMVHTEEWFTANTHTTQRLYGDSYNAVLFGLYKVIVIIVTQSHNHTTNVFTSCANCPDWLHLYHMIYIYIQFFFLINRLLLTHLFYLCKLLDKLIKCFPYKHFFTQSQNL